MDLNTTEVKLDSLTDQSPSYTRNKYEQCSFRNLRILRSEKTWRDTSGFKPKLRTYCTFKTEFVLENYLQ